MKLNPEFIKKLRTTARDYGDDNFFGVRSHPNEFFVSNWTFGFSFYPGEILNCPHVTSLEDETDRLCSNEKYRDVIQHIFRRGWREILVGQGIYQPAELVRMLPDEKHVFRQRGWTALPFTVDSGSRFYVREGYFDLVESILNDDFSPLIFRPLKTHDLRRAYRPMLLQDGAGDIRGMIGTISEDNMRNPVDITKEYRREVERLAPEFM